MNQKEQFKRDRETIEMLIAAADARVALDLSANDAAALRRILSAATEVRSTPHCTICGQPLGASHGLCGGTPSYDSSGRPL